MMKQLVPAILAAALTAVIIFSCQEKPEPPPVVPEIITKYDTVRTVPTWLQDSIKAWKKAKATTDTVELFYETVLVDTLYIPVDKPAEERPQLWPVLSYHSGGSFGDTAIVSTFSVRSGRMAVSKVYTAGILTAIEADSGQEPRLTYRPFPPEKGTSLFTKIKWGVVGFATCKLIQY